MNSKFSRLAIFTCLLLIACNGVPREQSAQARQWLEIYANRKFKDSIDVTWWEKGVDFYQVGDFYRNVWKGEDRVDLIYKDGQLWIRDTLVAFYWYNVDSKNLPKPYRITSIFAGDEVLHQLGNFPHLTHLKLGEARGPREWVDSSGNDYVIKPPAKDYGNLKQLSNLMSLDIRDAVISDEELKEIGQMSQLRELAVSCSPFITMAGNGLSPAGLVEIAGLDSLRVLVLANMWNLNRGDSFRYLSIVSDMDNLKALALDEKGNISDDDFKYLTNLHELRQLRISTCWGLKGTGFKYLRECENLEFIDLETCYYTRSGPNRGLVPFNLKSISKLPGLRTLYLKSMYINASNLKHISRMNTIRNLGLISCGIGNDEIEILTRMTQLERLNLEKNNLTSEQIDILNKILLDCEIIY